MDINLSQTLEDELRRKVKQERVRKFNEEARAAIESYNRFVKENGVWSKSLRTW